MNWFSYVLLLIGIMLVLAIIAIYFDKRKHWAVQTSAVLLALGALYCHVQAQANGEYSVLAQQIAEPLVKDILQPFALSPFGQQTMSAMRYMIRLLEQIVSFIDQYEVVLTIALSALICLVVWAWQKWNHNSPH